MNPAVGLVAVVTLLILALGYAAACAELDAPESEPGGKPMTESNGHAAAVAVAEPPTLARELAVYRRLLPGWLAGGREGKYVVIFREQVAGMKDSFDDALGMGCRNYGPQPFLVKQILADEPVHRI